MTRDFGQLSVDTHMILDHRFMEDLNTLLIDLGF